MSNRVAAWIVGISLVLFVAHIRLPDVIMQVAFLPWIGFGGLILTICSVLGRKGEKIELGEKKVWIPLAIIAVSIALSGVEAVLEHRISINEGISAASIGAFLFGVYLVSRKLGESIFKPMMFVVVIESVSIILWGMFHNWQPNGGLISPPNYDIATGLLVFCVLVSPVKHQWWLSGIAIIGLLFSGSAEAIIAIVILFVAIIIRRDWSWRLAVVGATVATVIIMVTFTGVINKIQVPTVTRLRLAVDILQGKDTSQLMLSDEGVWIDPSVYQPSSTLDRITGLRFSHSKLTMPIKPFGYGINLTKFYWGIPHNLILIVIEQVGILAAMSLLFIVSLQLKEKRMIYAWVGILALGLTDHYLFTQASPWVWSLAGVSSVGNIKSDLIFRRVA